VLWIALIELVTGLAEDVEGYALIEAFVIQSMLVASAAPEGPSAGPRRGRCAA